jgi:hypothetical protein
LNAIRDRLKKKPVHKKVLGLALGEKSLLVAEVLGGDQPTVTLTGELVYPQGVSPSTPDQLGAALGAFLSREGFTAKSVIVGLPARWLVTQIKEVPAADAKTLAEMLRLSAEAEFSTELKNLVYDFTGSGTSVLLVATPKKYVEAAASMCESARLSLDTVTATALALGEATGRVAHKDCLVLSVAAGGGEMTMQRDATAGALRHVRAPQPEALFINELRRTVSSMPTSRGGRELILWNSVGLDAKSVSDQVGVTVRGGDLALLGVSSSRNGAAGNGRNGADQSLLCAPAIALALRGVSSEASAVDFLHSRLAPPKEHRIPRWAVITGVAVLLLIAGVVAAYHDLDARSAALADRQNRYDQRKQSIDDATEFVGKVTFAQTWHGTDPRYLACVRDVTNAMSVDFDTFCTSLIISDAPHPPKTPDTHGLVGSITGKALDQAHVIQLEKRLRALSGWGVTPGAVDQGKGREVTFTLSFDYRFTATTQPVLSGKRLR